MRRHPVAVVVVGAAATAAILSAELSTAAAPAAAEPTPGAPDPRAEALLDRAAAAPSSTPYSGVQLISTWGASGTTSHLVDVEHRPGVGTRASVHATAAVPGRRIFAAEDGRAPSLVPSAGTLRLLARNFELAVPRRDSVAGRSAHVVEARRGGGQVAARFWIDARTGLLLRNEVYDDRGLVRLVAFVDVRVTPGREVRETSPPAAQPEEHALGEVELARLRAEGWSCPTELPPALILVDARRLTDGSGPTLHLTYSDGLSTVSLFQQRGALDESGLTGFSEELLAGTRAQVSDGYPKKVIWSGHGSVFTLFLETPDDDVAAIVAALPHDPADDDVAARLRRGLDRVVSWFNPFE